MRLTLIAPGGRSLPPTEHNVERADWELTLRLAELPARPELDGVTALELGRLLRSKVQSVASGSRAARLAQLGQFLGGAKYGLRVVEFTTRTPYPKETTTP